MKLLLTSSGITNPSIQDALVELLGKPIAESTALAIPTGIYPFRGGPVGAYRFVTGGLSRMCNLGWKSIGVLELTALPSVKRENWVADVREADVLLVFGGDVFYLRHWMQQSGLAELFAELHPEMVYVGVSAGAMVVTPHIGETFGSSESALAEDVKTEAITLHKLDGEPMNLTLGVAPGLGLVDFSLFPHLDAERHPDATLDNIGSWAGKLPNPLYAIDDQTAIKVVDGKVEVVSEGHWKILNPR